MSSRTKRNLWYEGNVKHVFPLHEESCDPPRAKFAIILDQVVEKDGEVDDMAVAGKQSNPQLELHVDFLGKWAEKCHFVKVGDFVTLKGLRREDRSDDSQMNNTLAFKLTAAEPSRGIYARFVSDGLTTSITSDSLHSFEIPPALTTRKRKAASTATGNNVPKPAIAHVYHDLSELVASENFTYNVYGVVTSYTQPRQTKGKDFVTLLTIVDQHDTSLDLILFFPQQNCPLVRQLGDVIRIHRLKIVEFQGKLQGNRGPGTALLLFSLDGGADDFEPYQIVSVAKSPGQPANYTFTDDDRDRVRTLMEWSNSRFCSEALDVASNVRSDYAKRLSDIAFDSVPLQGNGAGYNKQNSFEMDLYCRIVGISPPQPDSLQLQLNASDSEFSLLVWDGTDIPMSYVPEGGAALQVYPQAARRPKNALDAGSILRVVCRAEHSHILAAIADPTRTPPDAWMKIRHLCLRPSPSAGSDLVGHLDSMSAIMVLPPGHVEARRILHLYAERAQAARVPSRRGAATAAAATTTSLGQWGAAPVSTLREVLAKTAKEPVGKFRCRVRVVRYEPAEVADFVCYSRLQQRVVCACHLVVSDPSLQAAGSGADGPREVRVLACYEDFEELLGLKQEDLRTPDGRARCKARLDALVTRSGRSGAGAAGLDMCVKTYGGKRGEVVLRVFDTRIAAPAP